MSCLYQHVTLKRFVASLMVLGGAMFVLGAAQAVETPAPPAVQGAPVAGEDVQEQAQPQEQESGEAPPVSVFRMKSDGQYRYIAANGVPAVPVKDPVTPQSYVFRMSLKPVQAGGRTLVQDSMFFGVALDGVPFASANYPAEDGVYLYHGIPEALVKKPFAHVGYAADGFPIFVSQTGLFKSSYDAAREYKAGLGNLDQCNGAIVNKKFYIYVLTEDYPSMPLCWTGQADQTFTEPVSLEEPAPDSGDENAAPPEKKKPKYPFFVAPGVPFSHEQDSIRRRQM